MTIWLEDYGYIFMGSLFPLGLGFIFLWDWILSTD